MAVQILLFLERGRAVIIYVAVERGGDYEGAWTRNRVASFNRTDVEKYIEQRISERRVLILQSKNLNQHYKNWLQNNPWPNPTPVLQFPRWGGGLNQNQITQEMRDERARIKELNREISKQNLAKYNDSINLWLSEYRSYMADLGLPAKEDVTYSETIGLPVEETTFSIEEIDVI
jgi:hypothetical protein